MISPKTLIKKDLLKLENTKEDKELLEQVAKISGQNVFRCYQCGNCSSGCPVLEFMDITPTMIIKMSQTGDLKSIVGSNTIWVCASCLQCSSRCPKGIDVAAVMEAYREIMLRKNDITINVEKIDPKRRKELPTIAMVSAFRKFAGL